MLSRRQFLAGSLALVAYNVLTRRLLMAGGGSGAFAVPATYPPTGSGWTRSGFNPIIVASAAWEGGASGWVQEPTVLVEATTYTMFYTGGVSGSGTDYSMGRATCPIGSDPTIAANWTKYAGNPVLGKGGSGYAGVCSRNNILKIGTTYHCYFGNGTDLLHSTSSDGITWATPTTIWTAAAVGGGATQMTNSFVWQEASNDWRMMIEVVGGTWVDRIGYATSSDGLSWTMQNGGTYLSSLIITGGTSCGPQVIREGPVYHLWYHGATSGAGLPTDIYHATSTDLINWTITSPSPVFTHQGPGTFEYDQVADPSLAVVSGTAYLFYDGDNNTANLGGPWFKIGVASAPAVY